MATVQMHVRLPQELAHQIDKWVRDGRLISRSEAIKVTVSFYNEREKTRKFYQMLENRNKETKEKPERLVPIEKIR